MPPTTSPRVKLDETIESSRSRSSSIRTTSSSGDSGRATASAKQQRQSPKQTKPGTFRSFFSAKEPSTSAFEQLARKQRAELAEKGQQYPSGVPRGQVPASAAKDYKNQEATAKKMARMYEKAKTEGRRKSMPASFKSPTADPVAYRTLDPAQQRPSLDGTSRFMETTRPESYSASLAPVLENTVPRPPTSTKSTPTTPPNPSRRQVAPWEIEDEISSLPRDDHFSGSRKR
jgi:hypothetical protein